MSSLLAARAAFVSALESAPTLAGVQVSTHGGAFDLKQIRAYGKAAPHLVLTLLRYDASRQGGGLVSAEATWGLFAFTINTPGVLRDASCIALMEAATKVLLNTFAGDGAAQRPVEVTALNRFDGPLDVEGVAMWSMSFQSMLDLTEEIDTDIWQQMHAEWDLAPRDNDADLGDVLEAEDDIEIPQDP